MPIWAIILFLCTLGWQSCQKEGIVHHSFESNCWEIQDTLSFSLHPSQLSQDQTLQVEVSFLPEYRYANLYLKLLLTDPNGQQQAYLVNDTVIDPEGNWLNPVSSKIVHAFDPPIPLQMDQAGVYQAQLFQYMREQSLCEIQAVRVW